VAVTAASGRCVPFVVLSPRVRYCETTW
jgi:hypothetical protein